MPISTILSAIILLSWVAAGCATAPRAQKVSRQPGASSPASARSVDTVDYSPEVIGQRTEAHSRYAAGLLHDLQDEPEQAAEDYFRAAMADLSDEQLVLEASVRLLRYKQNDKALDLLKKATVGSQTSAVIYAQLGLVYSLAGEKELAIEAGRMAIRRSPSDMVGYRNLAQIHLQDGQTKEAFAVLDQASKQPDVDAAFLTELGDLYLHVSKTKPGGTTREQALDAFQRAAKENPTHPVVMEKLADGLASLGKLDAAAPLYEELLERFPALSGLREKAAELYLRTKDYAKAAEQYRALIRLNPTNPQAYYFLGSIASEEKRLSEAVDNFRKVLQLNPNVEPAYYELASAYLRLDQPTNALTTLEKARTKFKPNFVCEMYTAMAYHGLKQFTNTIRHLIAAEVIASATETNRLNHHFYFQLGAAYERNQQYHEAERSFRKSLALSPGHSETLNYLGYMWADRGVNLDEARQMIEKAVELEPDNAAYLDSLGWVLFKLNRPKEALPLLLKAIDRAKEPDATLQEHLGDVYSALQDMEKAQASWRKALSIEPNDNKEQIRRKIESSRSVPKTSATNLPR